jgi:uncharacterized protein (TIGR03083 family)
MDFSRLLSCLEDDFALLRAAVVSADPSARVPSCPDWSVGELARHVAEVYLHKAECIRLRAFPKEWPPGVLDPDPVTSLDKTHAVLTAQFSAHSPADPAATWHEPDQTVGFWIRRMAQETVIHRIDAELGTRQPVAPVPADLATDGIDELLHVFVAYSVRAWGKYFKDILANSPGRTFALQANGAAWRIRTGPDVFEVTNGAAADSPDVTLSGPPTAVLRNLWNRESQSESSEVTVTGPAEAITELRRCIVTATQ